MIEHIVQQETISRSYLYELRYSRVIAVVLAFDRLTLIRDESTTLLSTQLLHEQKS
jgi:hypothetical protein